MRTIHLLFSFFFLFFVSYTYGQNEPTWRELRANGANFYAIKAAFLRAHEAELRDSARTKRDKEEDDEYSQFMRWANWVEPRVSGYGGNLNIIYEGTMRALVVRNNEIEPRSGNWEEVGYKTTPLDYTDTKGANGRVNAIRIHPTDPDILYACTPAGGLWKSVNKGSSWTPISDNIAALGCTDVAIHPQNPQIMWLATGDGYGLTPGNVGNAFNNGAAKSLGVYMTTNGGTTWEPTSISYQQSNNVNHFLSRIIVNPDNPKVLLVGGSDGIYRSENGGKDWAQIDVAGVLTRRIWDIEFKPDDPEIVYAVSSSQFFRSDNGGKSWVQITTGLPTIVETGTKKRTSRMAIAVSKDNPMSVYAIIATNNDYNTSPTEIKTVNGLYGVYRSIHAGNDFEKIYPTVDPAVRELYSNDYLNILGSEKNGLGDNNTGGYGQSDYCFALAVSPTDAEKIYVGGINIWATKNNGNSWQLFSWSDDEDKTVHADIQDLIFSGNTLYAACDGGVYMKEGNDKWKNISSNLAISQPYRIDISPTNENYVVNALQDNGINFTIGGIKWQKIAGGDGENALIYKADPNIILGMLPNGFLYKITVNPLKREDFYIDRGIINETMNDGGNNFATITPLLHDPNNVYRIYAAGKKIYTLLDLTNNSTFRTFTESPSISSGIIKYMDIRDGLTAAERIIYTISADNEIRVGRLSLNNFTISWKILSSPAIMNLGAITSITASQNEPDVVYITYSNYEGATVFRSANRGDTWEMLQEGLPKVPVNCLTSPRSLTETLYVGTDIGVWYRDSYTGKWLPHNTRLPIVPIYDLKIHEATNKLYAATFGRGVWRSNICDLSSPDINSGVIANYPFNGNTNDESGNNYHVATNKATLTKDRFGNLNSAYHFDGTSSYMEVPYNRPFVSENHTISAWVKTSKSPDWSRIVVLPEGGNQHFSLNVNTVIPNKASIYFDKIGGGAIVTHSNKNVTNGTWHHLIGVINVSNKQMSMYVDGELENTTKLENTPITATQPLQIGRFSASEPEYFEGDIDDIRIYNRAITTEEAKMLYKNLDKGADLTFDGKDDFVDMGNVLNMGTNDFTVEAWYNTKDYSIISGNAHVILAKGTSLCTQPLYAGYSLYATTSGGSNSIEFNVNNYTVTTSNLLNNKWYHVAGVRQGNKISLYLDGVLVKTASTGSIVNTNSDYKFGLGTLIRPVGTSCGANTISFNGAMDEVRIWNRAVNPCDIDANRYCELKGNETGLMAYYKFNQGYANYKNSSETTLIDLAGGDQNGTLTNFDLQNTNSNWTNTDNTFLNRVCLTPIRQISKLIKCAKIVAASPKTTADIVLLNVFPNPFTGNVVVEYELPEEGPVFITICNMYGQTVHTVAKLNSLLGSQSEDIPLSILPNGLYFVKLKTAFGEVTTKVLKNN